MRIRAPLQPGQTSLLPDFLQHISISPSGCWLWTDWIGKNGYALYKPDPKTVVNAHKFAYETVRGKLPAGHEAHHRCHTRHCVNPWCLEPKTHQENKALDRLTVCRRGLHAMTGDNVEYRYSRPRQQLMRRCKACRREYQRLHRSRPEERRAA